MTVRRAFSLIEIVVVLVILAILLAISVPFLQQMREIARRSNCDQNLIRLSLAIAAYEQTNTHFPAGTSQFNADYLVIRRNAMIDAAETDDSANNAPIVNRPIINRPEGYHHNWLTGILPWLDRQGVYEQIDRNVGVYHPNNAVVRDSSLVMTRCPTTEGLTLSVGSNYAGNHASSETPIDASNDGLLIANGWLGTEAITDGAAFTILLWESRTPPILELGWMSGTRSTLRNGGHMINESFPIGEKPSEYVNLDPLFVGGSGSFHVGGASVAMADGSIQFLTETIDQRLLREKSSRDDELFFNEASAVTPARPVPPEAEIDR
jgi:prepilin-type N-terminal cleavage/methylation domain-containing protein